jgi:selenocysteine lyase/cysteine desulfurase
MCSVHVSTKRPAESKKPFDIAKEAFLDDFPEYQLSLAIDELRAADYSILDQQGHVYLDYTGSGLYGGSQILSHSQLLRTQVFGNPHSSNPTSENMNQWVAKTRSAVLRFFHADPEEYVCIFTQNASGALKLVGESYPFCADSKFLLTYDNHNSVNGIREFARVKGAGIVYIPMTTSEMRLDQQELLNQLQHIQPGSHSLFAYPAQSNFSGVKHSLSWISTAQALGWDVLLDAAAFVPTNSLDLSTVHPDFVSLSFYKIFGYPTGVGALIARRAALSKLKRPWFAGGTITVASVQGDRHYLHVGAEGFEDGTLNFLNLPAVEIGLSQIQKVGYTHIHQRVSSLTGWLLSELSALRHDNGLALLKIYGPIDNTERGGTLAMNFFDKNGNFIDHNTIEALANREKISIRTGCFCNPGDGETALGISKNELNVCFSMKPRLEYQDLRTCIDGKSTGAVRISIGIVSNFEDVYKFVELARGLLNKLVGDL